MTTTLNYSQIEKETIPTLKFPKGDVLTDVAQISERTMRLGRAIRLGNNHKRKVKIDFKDTQGDKRVETTIWAVTEKNIVLKAGVIIPIERVTSIHPY